MDRRSDGTVADRALRATGHPEQAIELYERTRVANWAQVWLHAMVGPEILIDLGRLEEARAATMRGRELTHASGSLVSVMLNELIEAKLEIRLHQDPHAALAVLDRLEDRKAATEYRFIGEAADVWRGLALLALNDDESALFHLERAVETMVASDRLLELPTAAVYLSEARWRAGDEDGADAAADLAHYAATRQGSNDYLLQALRRSRRCCHGGSTPCDRRIRRGTSSGELSKRRTRRSSYRFRLASSSGSSVHPSS